MVGCFSFNHKQRGQSLVEVVVAVGAMSILLVSLLSLISLSLKNSRLARDRAKAVSLAQEGIELMRARRDYDWTGFKNLANGSNYLLPGNWVVADGLAAACDQSPSINETFWRCAELNLLGINEVEIIVTVGWNEGRQGFSTKQITNLSLWER